MAGLLVVLLLAAVAAGFLVQQQAKQNRRTALAALASQLGLQYVARDTLRIIDFPFDLFQKGDGRGIENMMWGAVDGVNVRLFDYWYYDETRDSKGVSSGSYKRFTCAISEIPADCPHLSVRREGVFSHLADHLGMADIAFESDDFNREFEVRCSDQKFAFSLVDGRMMEWLMQAATAAQFETGGPMVFVATGKLDPSGWPSLLAWQRQFREHVPEVVYSTYPRA